MLKIKEILYKTIMNDGEEYENRYIFKGKLNELLNNGFIKLKENDVIEELKLKVPKDDEVYYKKSGLGYFIICKDGDDLLFMSGVPIWWIGDENETNYYEDLEKLIKADLVEKLESEE